MPHLSSKLTCYAPVHTSVCVPVQYAAANGTLVGDSSVYLRTCEGDCIDSAGDGEEDIRVLRSILFRSRCPTNGCLSIADLL